MKSMNTKKIAAVAAGAALLGGALLGAVSFENTELINNNGQIMAKVVVGEKAAASDGVAAANIAAVLGNRAFKQVAVSATPTGLDALTCSGTGAGTCEVLSKSVTLEVTTPAGTVPAGAYGFKTLITDYVDADLEDRNNTDSSDKENTPWGTIAAMKVGGDDFPALADYTVKDPQSTFSTTEEQYAYVTSEKVHYDDDESEFLAEQVKLAYEIEFMDDGIPLCSDSKSGYWAYCVDTTQTSDNNVDKALENHRVKVKFLGDEWIISGMDVEDDTVKLAKESAYSPKLQIGESLDLGDGNKLVLGDLKPASGGQTADIAIFSVKDASGKEIASKTVAQGATTEIQAGTKSYRVRVYQVAPGYTLTEKWAEVAVFADELELIDGDELEGNEDAWEVAIEWSDKDANTGDYSNSTIKEDHLTKIQLKGIDYADLYKGDYMTIVEDPAKFKLTFTGLDLTDKDYLKVSVTTEKAGGTTVYDVNTTVSDDTGYRRLTGDNSTTNKESQIKIKADDGIFTVYDEDGKKFDKVSELLFSPFGAVNYSNKSVWLIDKAALFFKKDSKYYRAYNSSGNVYTTAGTSMEIPYELSGDTFNMYIGIDNRSASSSDFGTFNASASGAVFTDDDVVYIWFAEDIGNDQTGKFALRLVEKNAEATGELVFDAVEDNDNDNEDEVWYGSDATTKGTVELPYYTERGTKLDGGETSFTVKLAKKVGKLGFVLQTTGATETSANTYEQTLKEGEQLTLSDGTKVKVKAINCQTGSCTAGTGSVSGTDKVSCQVNANVANLGERQNIASDLVVLDSAFSGTETVIAVGGPAVNTVTKAIVSGTGVTFEKAGDVVVQEVETGRIVVAGYNAQDTLAAAQQFIAKLA